MNAETIGGIIIAIMGSNLLVEFFKAWREDKKVKDNIITKEDFNLLATGVRNLESIRLSILLKEWKHAEERTADDWEDIEDLYANYRKLGGNGRIKKLYEECKNLETTE